MIKDLILKMWAEYNHSAYPIVEVNMKGNIGSDEEFELFTDEWLELYEKKRDFVLIFDTRNLRSSSSSGSEVISHS